MQIVLIIVFAVVLSLPGRELFPPILPAATGTAATLKTALVLSASIPLAAGLGSWLCVRRLRRAGGFSYASMLFGRLHTAVHIGLLALLGWLIFQTGWVGLVHHHWGLDRYPLVGELVLAGPVLLTVILCWLAMYPADRALRISATAGLGELLGEPVWTLGQYLDFQIRYQLLTVAVPMSLFILASDLMTQHADRLIVWTGQAWAPDLVLAVTAGLIFLCAPVLLRHLWRTRTLADSPLRRRLEQTCRRMGLRYRQILVWQSHGAMVNAAVMGLLPPVRYILLSDGLLDHLSDEQVESVFGHEAGHVRERHIAWYMLFALSSMMAVGLADNWMQFGLHLPRKLIDPIVMGLVVAIWGVFFGWISRRFERQADLYGVRSLDGEESSCQLPCWRHNPGGASPPSPCLCTTAAGVFSSALEAVAALNGISKYARSWRHSSIASRQEFIHQAAVHPRALHRFERTVRVIKAALLGLTLALACVSAWFYWPILFPRGRGQDGPQYRTGPSYLVTSPPASDQTHRRA